MKNRNAVLPMSQEMLKIISDCGYRKVKPDDQVLFDLYYDKMNQPWSAATSFLNAVVWEESLPVYFKEYEGVIIGICYIAEEKKLVGIPFIGHYTDASVARSFAVLKKDLQALHAPVVIMDVTKWMLPYYESIEGEAFDVEDRRDYMEYIYQTESFEAGMNKQDDRYRYHYFMRKFNYETEEITKDHREEIFEFMEQIWCGNRDCKECDFGCLLDGTDRVLSVYDRIRADGILVRVDGKMVGFCIVTKRMGQGVYQFKHALKQYKGINEYLLRECYERFLKDVDFINYTEDCGIESLRRYKMNLAEEYSLSSRLTLVEK